MIIQIKVLVNKILGKSTSKPPSFREMVPITPNKILDTKISFLP